MLLPPAEARQGGCDQNGMWGPDVTEFCPRVHARDPSSRNFKEKMLDWSHTQRQGWEVVCSDLKGGRGPDSASRTFVLWDRNATKSPGHQVAWTESRF